MDELTKFEVAPLEKRDGPSWIPLAISAMVHCLILASLLLHPFPAQLPLPQPNQPAEAGQRVALQRLPPLPPPHPADASKPQPPIHETALGPDSKKPDAEVPQEKGPEKPPPDPDQIDPSKKLGESAPPAVTRVPDKSLPSPTPADESSMRYIQGPSANANGTLMTPTSPWGRTIPDPAEAMAGNSAQPESKTSSSATSSGHGRVGFDPGAMTNLWRPSFKEAAGQCVKIPDLGVDANGKPVLAVVQGRVYWEDHHTPLSGAQLQIVGTAFTTFSDDNGEYALRFDPRMLEKCRIQYVQVRAAGFNGALLTLSIGERVRSDDVLLRRK